MYTNMKEFDFNQNNTSNINKIDAIDITNSESDIMSIFGNNDARFSNLKNTDKINYDGAICNGGCNELNSHEIIFILACKYDYTIIVDYILSNNIVDRFNISLANDKNTPLHHIIENWKDDEAHKKILNSFLNRKNLKTFIDSAGIDGDTPIVLATKKGHSVICEMLDKYGADKTIENVHGLCVVTDESEYSSNIYNNNNNNIRTIDISSPNNIVEDNELKITKNADIFLSGLIDKHARDNGFSDTSMFSMLSSNNNVPKFNNNQSTFITNLDKFMKNLTENKKNIQGGGFNDKITGTRQMYSFNTNSNKNSNRNSNMYNEKQYVSELDKLINEQVSMIDKRAAHNVQSILNVDKKQASNIINKIYGNIDKENPSLKHLDKAMAMEKYINVDDLNKINEHYHSSRNSHSKHNKKSSHKKSSHKKSSHKKSSKKSSHKKSSHRR